MLMEFEYLRRQVHLLARRSSSTSTTGTTASTRSIVRRRAAPRPPSCPQPFAGTESAPIVPGKLSPVPGPTLPVYPVPPPDPPGPPGHLLLRHDHRNHHREMLLVFQSKMEFQQLRQCFHQSIRGSKTAVSTTTNLDGCRYWVCSDGCSSGSICSSTTTSTL